jgi:hypothetical protein
MAGPQIRLGRGSWVPAASWSCHFADAPNADPVDSAAYTSAAARLQGPAQFVYFNTNADYLNRLGRTLQGGEQTFKTEGQRANLRPSFAFGVTREDGFFVESRTPLGTFPRMLTAVSSRLGGEEKKKDGGAE